MDQHDSTGDPARIGVHDGSYNPTFPVAGIGASAGGLEAFSQLLRELPRDAGLAIVLVSHLSPSHESALPEILARVSALPVVKAESGMRVEINHIYVLPAGQSISIASGALVLSPRDRGSQQRVIDEFFQSLAHDQGQCAIGVVLSGTGNDGTAGLEEVKAAGGITFAQDESAEHDEMPGNAVAAGCVDSVQSPADIARELVRIARHPLGIPGRHRPHIDDASLKRILGSLQATTNVDFRHYKSNTLGRRIARRMVLTRTEAWPEYADLLVADPVELDALFHDLLIGVTSFFRNPEMFDALQSRVLPGLFKDRLAHDPVRVWVLGCSTGEEAYSFGIAIAEYMASIGAQVPVQIFATDLNAKAIEKARAGTYSKRIAQDMSPARLRSFFVESEGGYRVSKAIRDMCVFARHNVLTDTPFSRMDIVSCRNMLIYVEPVLQQRILPLLHYSLKGHGVLVLGSSESLGGYRDLFEPVDSQQKLFVRKPGSRTMPVVNPAKPAKTFVVPAAPEIDRLGAEKEMDRILLSRYTPAAVMINSSMEILQFRGDTSRYLTPAPGKASMNVLKMAREGLLVALRAAVVRALRDDAKAVEAAVSFRSGAREGRVNIEAVPIRAGANGERACLVLFEEVPSPNAVFSPASTEGVAPVGAEDDAVARLTQELNATREYLQSVIEQQEEANEALQSANEEAQSSNEELQSINEELETSKEEIQSTNEELATVNDELSQRNRELASLNNDLVNLIDTAVVIVDRNLKIRRFTPVAERTFNLIAADIGRPITDIQLNLGIENVNDVVVGVIDNVRTFEREVRDRHGRWCLLRVRPYKTLENRIDGAVLMLFDIDTLKRDRDLAESVVANADAALVVLEEDLSVRSASRSFYEIFGGSPRDTEGRPFASLGGGELAAPALRELLQRVASNPTLRDEFELEHESGIKGRRCLRLKARSLQVRSGEPARTLVVFEDVTDERRLVSALEQIARMSEAERRRDEFLAMIAHELRNPMSAIKNATSLLSHPEADQALRTRLEAILARQVSGMSRLIDDLLDAARVTHGKIELKTELQDLAPIVDSALESVRPVAAKRGQTLEITLPPEALFVDVDAARIEQVISNLLQNASKFTPSGGHVELEVEFLDSEDAVLLHVRDDGEGIDPALLPRIFDLFTQAGRAHDRPLGGLGIGLSVARRLVHLHGGTLEARSAGPGQGSEFTVRLPARRLRDAPVSAPMHEHRPAHHWRILVVDDDEDVADMLASSLRLEGHAVQLVTDPVGALAAAREMKPDVAVLDIGMPGLDGYELARRLRADAAGERMFLVALTGFGKQEDKARAMAAGFDRHVTKPADFKALLDIIADGVEARRIGGS